MLENLRTFNATLKMQQAVLTLMVQQLSTAEDIKD